MIACVLSPGSFLGTSRDFRPEILPTGHNYRVVSEKATRTIDQMPDAMGRIVILSTPFFEAPWIRVSFNADDEIESAQAIGLPSYTSVDDYLGQDRIYGFRFTFNSVTGSNATAALDMKGNTTLATVPLGLDSNRVCQAGTGSPSVNAWPYRMMRTIDRPPLRTDEVASVTSSYYKNAAREGSYLVLRHTDSSLPFTFRSKDEHKAKFNQYAKAADGTLQSVQVKNLLALSTPDDIAFIVSTTFENDIVNLDSPNNLSCSSPSHMELGVTIYEGLSPENIISFKLIAGWELIPKMDSPKVSQAYQVPPLNPAFIRGLALAESRVTNLGCAADNDLSSFLSGLGKVWDVVSPVAKAVSTLLPPQYGSAVSAVAGAGDMIRNVTKQPEKSAQPVYNKAAKVNADAYQTIIVPRQPAIVDTRSAPAIKRNNRRR